MKCPECGMSYIEAVIPAYWLLRDDATITFDGFSDDNMAVIYRCRKCHWQVTDDSLIDEDVLEKLDIEVTAAEAAIETAAEGD